MENSEDHLEPDSGSQSANHPYGDDLGSDSPTAEVVEAVLASEPTSQPPTHRPLSLSGYISWLVVAALTLGIFSLVATSQLLTEEQVGGDAGPIDLMQVQLQGKFVVGQRELSKMAPGGSESPPPPLLDVGCYEQRICYSILLNETESATEAIEHLEELEALVEKHELELTDNQTRLNKIVYELLGNYESGNPDSDSIPESDREFLQDRLDWFGDLVLYPSDSPHTAKRNAITSGAFNQTVFIGIGILLGLLALMAGFVLAIVFATMLFSGKLKSHFANHATDHNIYIETFAIWISIFFGASLLMQFSGLENPTTQMMLQPVIFFGSLMALLWPVFRGVSFAQVKRDIGWTSENPFKEVASAMGAYLALLPFLIPGLILIVLIMTAIGFGSETPHEFARQSGPGHPIQEDIMSGNFVTICFVFLATCVAAPVVEETMFRGVLYRHLRDWTASWQLWTSVGFSAILNGLIFAAIHPQGLVAIPILATLAIGFTLTRQWRGSLLAPMTMHAIHNFLITCFSVLIL